MRYKPMTLSASRLVLSSASILSACRRPALFTKLALLLIVLVIGVSSCGPQTSTLTLTPVTVQLSWFHQAEFAGLYAAEQLGYFEEEGLQVAFVEGGLM